MTKPEFLARVMKAMISEIEVAMQRDKGISQVEANQRLADAIKKSF